jgi:hypothetical protein
LDHTGIGEIPTETGGAYFRMDAFNRVDYLATWGKICMKYDLVALGPEGRFYLNAVLGGGTSFFQSLAKACDLKPGRAFAFLPPDCNQDGLYKFLTGGMLPPAAETRRKLAEFLLELLEGHARYLLISENRCARKGDPWLATSKSRIITCGDEIYHWADERATADVLMETFKDAESAIQTGFGVFTRLPENLSPPPLQASSDWFQALIPHCLLLGVTAYDGETYIIWQILDPAQELTVSF